MSRIVLPIPAGRGGGGVVISRCEYEKKKHRQHLFYIRLKIQIEQNFKVNNFYTHLVPTCVLHIINC